MDDPWANAWHDPARPQPEADIALPSWSTGTAVPWTESSPDQSALWVPSEPPGTAWASPYDSISLGKPSCSPVPQPASSEPTSEPQTIHTPPPASPDAFGSFETVLKSEESDLDPWAAGSVLSPAQEDVWVQTPEQDVKSVDEWEEAKQQKARQDEHVPPEILASILDNFKSLSSDLWPTQSSPQDNTPARSGLESVEGLDSITSRLIPRDLTLPSSVQFSKTFTAKHMGDALRLSRHVPITRLSPLTLYMASKGSTAWEVSVKSRVDLTNDDLLPPGWRVVEKEKEEPVPAVETKKKGSGRLLSFFGRKSTNSPVEANLRRSESPGRAPSIPTTVSSNGTVPSPSIQSARPSLDTAKSPTHSSTPNLLGASTVADSTPTASAPSSQTTAPGTTEQTPQAPSAVSRFLGRFARSKPSESGEKESLALSTDDLEFLSDIVPSASDDADEHDQLKGLSNMQSSPSLSTALPPLLPAPPRAPPTNFISENLTPQLSKPAATPQEDPFSIFDSPPTMSKPTIPATQPIVPSLPPPTSIPPLRPPTSSLYRSESHGAPSSSRFSGRSSSPFDTSSLTSRSQTPSSGRRAPIAIMSTRSSASNNSTSIAALPPPPILPPPPPTKFTSTPSHSRASSQHNHNILEEKDDFESFRAPPSSQPSLLPDTSTSSVFSDQSLFSDTSTHHTNSNNNNFFDDFDDFISSPIDLPRPPAKPTLFSQPSTASSPAVPPQPPQPQPPTKHPSPPRKTSRAAEHQRTLSLVNIAASRTGRWPAPPSPLPELLPPPPGGPHAASTSGTAGPSSSMQVQQKNALASEPSTSSSPSGFPFLSPPAGFSGLQTSTMMSPLPPPRLGVGSPAPMVDLMQHGRPAPVPPAPQYTPSATPGGLSEQDLSFFEGL
ncbi:hypothetical protein C0995_008515 [Termitomyces sp. Mi166|nr:hypothetical protein C0995_008515 [Termitomyces sp. Mi166\